MDDPRVTAGAGGKTRGDVGKQFLGGARRHQVGGGLAAGMERIALAERDHLLDERLCGPGARERGGNALAFNDVGHQVAERGAAMRRLAPEFRAIVAVAHAWVLRAPTGPRSPPASAAPSGWAAAAR